MPSNSERPKTPENSSSSTAEQRLSSSPFQADTETSPTRSDAGGDGKGYQSLQAFVEERGAPKPSSRPQTSSGKYAHSRVPSDGVFSMSEGDEQDPSATSTT